MRVFFLMDSTPSGCRRRPVRVFGVLVDSLPSAEEDPFLRYLKSVDLIPGRSLRLRVLDRFKPSVFSLYRRRPSWFEPASLFRCQVSYSFPTYELFFSCPRREVFYFNSRRFLTRTGVFTIKN